jgi:hypothetical protein
MSKRARVPAMVTREEVENAFPWVQYLPEAAIEQFVSIIENYHAAARIYSRKPAACLADP